MKIDATNKQAFGMKFTFIGPNAAKYAKETAKGFTKECIMAVPIFCEKQGMVHVASGQDYFEFITKSVPPCNGKEMISDFFKDAIKIVTN